MGELLKKMTVVVMVVVVVVADVEMSKGFNIGMLW